MRPVTVVGVDPGTIYCGMAALKARGGCSTLLAIANKEAPKPQRLLDIGNMLSDFLDRHKPKYVAFEKAYVTGGRTNLKTIGALEQARGVVMVYAATAGARVIEVAHNTAKKELTGDGKASKSKVMRFAQLLTGKKSLSEDEADAVAIALVGWRLKNIQEWRPR